MPDWEAELAIDHVLVRGLLAEQFPELDAGSARLLGEGWDNSVWVVEESWAFRFPRRDAAVALVARELALLPRLGPLLPVPIPQPRFVGKPSDRYPWPFVGAPLLAGQEAADAALDDETRCELGVELGRFLRTLHDVELEVELPHDPNGRADMVFRVPRTRECLAEMASAGLRRLPSRVGAILEDALGLLGSESSSILHGDLHVRHVLVHGDRLSGVIDWGDACVGDPSIDLHVAWSLLPPAGRARFVDAYGPIDAERLLRARVTALYFCAMLATYAHSVGNANLERECLAGLERTLVDWD